MPETVKRHIAVKLLRDVGCGVVDLFVATIEFTLLKKKTAAAGVAPRRRQRDPTHRAYITLSRVRGDLERPQERIGVSNLCWPCWCVWMRRLCLTLNDRI